jgi:catechol 2,3-dioxygenase-like lactoylglutathione lyase family enzyme
MAVQLTTRAVHHVSLTVADMARTRQFYTEVLGFQVAMELPTAVLLANGSTIVGIHPAPDPSRAPADDRFDENRIGLDHLAFTVDSREELERAKALFDEWSVPHGEIEDLAPIIGLNLYVLFFRDPDNMQLELCAAY